MTRPHAPLDRDEIPVVRVDAEPYSAATTTIERVRPLRRWRELTLLGVAVAVVIGVGALGDGGGPDDAAAGTTTTTVKQTTTTTRRSGAATRRSTTTTTPRPTTTTSWPQLIAGAGPLVPGGGTHTLVAVLHDERLVTIVDLDTGSGCTTGPPDGPSFPFVWTAVTSTLVIGSNDGAFSAVTRDCQVHELPGMSHNGYGWFSDVGVWLMIESSDHARLVEHELPSGEPTGREVRLPRYAGPQVVMAGDRLVVGALGDMTMVDPADGSRRALGPGSPIAATADVLAYATCPELACHLVVVDLASGERRSFDDIEAVPWELGAISPDGRFLRTTVADESRREPVPALVDLDTGAVELLPSDVYQAVFTADGGWLVAERRGGMVAFRPGETEIIELDMERPTNGWALVIPR